ncbi:hypothetical protein HYDPIDRAFT_36167 [Hydnomerulius pinastri MD-312]|nr:hypothetical protein HYDPIDRAFT_36167 [Hydnomerulius pinastri MD-312]
MVRQHSPQARKTTPRARSSTSQAFKSPFADRNRTATKQKIQTPRKQLRSPCGYSYSSKAVRDTDTGRSTGNDRLREYRDFDDVEDDQLDEENEDRSDDDANWDEETTLIALLDDHDEPGHDDKTSIVDRLGPAFAAHAQGGKEYIKQTLIPVIQRTRHVHDIIDEDITVRHLQGLSLFDKSSRRLEDAARREYDAVQTAYAETKKSLEALFSSLQDLTNESDALFHEFKAAMEKHVQRMRQCAEQLPGDVERLISKLDKKAKHLGAEDHAKAKERLLRGILDKY